MNCLLISKGSSLSAAPNRSSAASDGQHAEKMSRRPRKAHSPNDRRTAKTSPAILALQRELQGRFVSSGGRPSDAAPTIRRLVPVRKQVWKELQRRAALLSRLGQPVSPGQLAALLLERGVSELRRLSVDS